MLIIFTSIRFLLPIISHIYTYFILCIYLSLCIIYIDISKYGNATTKFALKPSINKKKYHKTIFINFMTI